MRKTKGFTVIEFILYFMLLTLVITAVTGFAVDVVKSRNKARIVAEVEQNARLVMLRTLRAIRRADGLNIGASTFDNDNGVLSLSMSAAATNPTIFDLSAGVARIKEGSGAATALTTPDVTVTKFRFAKDNAPGGNKTVTVELGMEYNTTNTDAAFDYTMSTTSSAMIRKQ